MAHVGKKYNFRLGYYPLYPEIDHNVFKECDWSEFYRDVNKTISINTPKAQGKEVDICMFVDSGHTGGNSSRSGFLINVNTALCNGSQRSSLQ